MQRRWLFTLHFPYLPWCNPIHVCLLALCDGDMSSCTIYPQQGVATNNTLSPVRGQTRGEFGPASF